MHLIKRRANPHPPFNTARERAYSGNFLSAPSPYSRKPGPFGANVSICAKGVSTGVHNIAFSLSPDCFCENDLLFCFQWECLLKEMEPLTVPPPSTHQ